MNHNVLVFTRDAKLLSELDRRLAGKQKIVACETLEALPERLKSQPVEAVLVHLERSTLNGYSPARFIAELDDSVETAPLYGLLDENCPPRLKRLAQRTIGDCFDFPLDYDRLGRLLTEKQDIEGELAGFWRQMPHKELHGKSRSLVTFTPAMFDTMDELKVAARHNVTALLIGETGCGKTFLARLIHELSDRANERFCTVACGALPPDLIESELFGNVKGAFTGADKDREGKFAAAGRGTLLLDEIDVLPLEQQAKLLRVIETGEFEPVGSNETQHSQARLVVASNYNLEQLVRSGNFRTDLYYRLNILNFRLLPLRERPRDIEYLARKFALEHSRTHGIQLRAIEPAFLETLRMYHWPGNVREMENVIRRAVLYCQRGILSVQDLPSSIRGASVDALAADTRPSDYDFGSQRMAGAFQGPLPAGMGARLGPDLPTRSGYGGDAAAASRGAVLSDVFRRPVHNPLAPMMGEHLASASVGGAAVAERDAASLEARVDVMERRIIAECLQRNNYRRKETAAELGISRVTLYNKMKKFGLM